MTAEATDAPQKTPGKGRKILKFFGYLLGSAILAGAGFGAGFVYFANPLSPNSDVLALIEKPVEHAAEAEVTDEGEPMPKRVPKPVPEQELYVTSYYTFPEALTSNLADSRRFIQISIGISTQYDASVITNVETHTLALKSDILTVLSGFSEEAAGTKEGREKLAVELRDAMNARLEQLEGFGGIEHVYFPSFVLQ